MQGVPEESLPLPAPPVILSTHVHMALGSQPAVGPSGRWPLKSELGPASGSHPALPFTFAFTIIDNSSQGTEYLACFLLFCIFLCIQ